MSDVELITEHGNAGRLADARACFERLERRAADRADDPAARLALADGATRLIAAYGKHARLGEASASLSHFSHWPNGHSWASLPLDTGSRVLRSCWRPEELETLGTIRNVPAVIDPDTGAPVVPERPRVNTPILVGPVANT